MSDKRKMRASAKAKIGLALSCVFYVAFAAVTVGVAFALQRAVDFAGEGDLGGLVTTIAITLAVMMPLFFLSWIAGDRFRFGYVREMLLTVKRHRMGFLFAMRNKAPLEEKDLSFFTADADILQTSYYSALARVPYHVATFAFALAALLWINWIVALVAIAVSMLPLLATGLFSKGLARRKKAYSDAAAGYVDVARECIEGRKEIIAYDKQDVFMRRHDVENQKTETARLKSDFFETIANGTSGALIFLVQIVVLGLSSYFVITGDLTFGFMIAIVQLSGSVLSPIGDLVNTINGVCSAKTVLEKARETAEPEPARARVSEFNDAIEIKELGLRYVEDEYVVKDLSLTFKRGGKYAIHAPSGYGKTSIARALAREFADFDGAITLDGKDIREIDAKDYNKILRYVRQDPYLFTDTALNNLAFFDAAPDKAKIDRALSVTKADEFLPDDEALSRPVSNTSGLSGGQKQRIVLARALLHSPKVLVLDEITSGVDLETACGILKDLFEDKSLTCIAITHERDERFLSLFDEVVRLEGAA